MSERHVLDEQSGAVLTLTLNRAEKRNALGNQLRAELDECLARAGEDDSISVIVIKANGPDFSAGMDVRANIGVNNELAAAQRGVTRLQDFMLRVRDVPKPTIAQVHGHCVGLATQLAICCDIVVAAEDARIGVPGWPNDWIADWWVFRVGAQRAKLMNFTSGSLLSGLEAVEWGFAARAFPADRLDAETQRLATWDREVTGGDAAAEEARHQPGRGPDGLPHGGALHRHAKHPDLTLRERAYRGRLRARPRLRRRTRALRPAAARRVALEGSGYQAQASLSCARARRWLISPAW